MFGYVIPYRKTLSETAQEEYRADYCGLCRCLGKRYGFPARFLVSYDGAFLCALLLAQENTAPAPRCFCPAHPFCRKRCAVQNAPMEFAADVSVLLMCWKLRDTVADGGFFSRKAAHMALLLLRRMERRATEFQPEFSALSAAQLEKLRQLEEENSPSIDRTADTFGMLLSGCAASCSEESTRRILAQILYHTGRFLYLADALDDLAQDCRKNQYNPLRFRYHPDGGKLTEPDRTELLQTMDCSVAMAASALALLDCSGRRELLENIIHFGMPAVLHAVAAGVFHKRRNRSRE